MEQNKHYTDWELYVLDCIHSDDVDVDALSDKEKIQFLLDTFDKEYNTGWEKRNFPELQKRIANWLQRLPSTIGIVFSDYDIVQTTWKLEGFQMNPQNAVWSWWRRIACVILSLARKNSVDVEQYL